ncbi:MAG TPA: hypothetical protein VGI12_09435 [Vicinamibacterales bacterium]
MAKGATAAPAKQLAGFIAKFSPAIARDARGALTRIRRLVPAGAFRMVYDNYNGLVVGFGPNARPSDAIVSILVVADHVTLCFINDAPSLPDPEGLLKGSGNVVRHVRLASARDLDRPAILTLVKTAIARSDVPFPRRGPSPLIVKSISTKQRPRRKLS